MQMGHTKSDLANAAGRSTIGRGRGAINTFNHLTPEIIAQVVEKFVLQLEAQLADRDVTIELSDEASKWLIAHGYDQQMGARPMARVIQEHIKKPLADEVLFGKLKAGGHVKVILTKD